MEIINILNGIRPMPPELINYLQNILKTKTLKKKEYLLKTGEVCENVYFVQEGLLKCFSLGEEGEEDCKWFMKENDLMYAPMSFYKQKPSKESIQALKLCTLQYFSHSELDDACDRFIEFSTHRRILSEKFLLLREDRTHILLEADPLDRYVQLLEYYPEYIRRVPDKDIASYLRVPLSKMKQLKKMAKQSLSGNIRL